MVDVNLKVVRATMRPCSTKLVLVELIDVEECDLLVQVDISKAVSFYGVHELLSHIGKDKVIEYLEFIESDEER
ncbi:MULTISPECIES: hypothetical protein [Olivibacter]|uniref:Uncharacterized protein n=1 Tax=Olivibacter jilunii TaxID=985016 RepID=A0ABW6AZF5_9SPHI|nr:hypothetical protein [Pseudosphingobacterium sp.]